MIIPNNHRLLKAAADADDVTVIEMLEEGTRDGITTGICTRCEIIIAVEADANEDWCEECNTRTVRSVLNIAGLI